MLMVMYRGVKVIYLGLSRWRFIFSPECRMDQICRGGIKQMQHVIDYHLDYKDIWGLW